MGYIINIRSPIARLKAIFFVLFFYAPHTIVLIPDD